MPASVGQPGGEDAGGGRDGKEAEYPVRPGQVAAHVGRERCGPPHRRAHENDEGRGRYHSRAADNRGLPACRSATDTIPVAITIANARGSAPRTAGASISLGEGGSLVFVAGHELVEDGGQLVQALQVSPGQLLQDLVPLRVRRTRTTRPSAGSLVRWTRPASSARSTSSTVLCGRRSR